MHREHFSLWEAFWDANGAPKGIQGPPWGARKGCQNGNEKQSVFQVEKVSQKGSKRGAKSMKKASKMGAGTRVLKNRKSGGVPFKDPN